MNREHYLIKKANSLPKSPGCYLMKGDDDQILYVGKAKNLRSRVSSYFTDSLGEQLKTRILVSKIRDFDFILTANDGEAFVLENNLIKRYSPRYNILLKDDKSYPYVVVEGLHEHPRLQCLRRIKKRDKWRHTFGPFAVGSNIREIVRILTKSFRLRDCSVSQFNNSCRTGRPCILYQMLQCSAPCVGKISTVEYEEDLKRALKIFSNKGQETLKELTKKMDSFAAQEQFEAAAIIRDNLTELEKFVEKSSQKNVDLKDDELDLDVIAHYQEDRHIDISIYMIRGGILLGHKNFHFSVRDFGGDLFEHLITYVFQYYINDLENLPKKVIMDLKEDQILELQSILQNSSDKKIKVSTGKRKFKSLLDLTYRHAKESQRVRIREQEDLNHGLDSLKELLVLPERPSVMECYDIAVWQGKSPTASQVVFKDGKPDRSSYRYYHIEERAEGNNDFAMLEELLRRRLVKGDLPHVMVVDGGIAQVNSLLKILELNEISIPVVGIAKSRILSQEKRLREGGYDKNGKSDERLILPGRLNPYVLKRSSSLFRIMTQMRDEAHRFSRKLHHKAEKKRIISSWLDEIKGIGEKRKIKVLERLDENNKDTMERLSKMEVNELQQFLGLSQKICENIYDYLKDRSS